MGFAIHRHPKHGHLEKVYENALAHRLRKLGLDVKQQYPLKVYDEDGTLIGDYNGDGRRGRRDALPYVLGGAFQALAQAFEVGDGLLEDVAEQRSWEGREAHALPDRLPIDWPSSLLN